MKKPLVFRLRIKLCWHLRARDALERVGGAVSGGRGAVRVHAHSLVALSWKLDHRLAIVSRSAKFIINTARAAERCQTERESRANCSPGRKTAERKAGAGESEKGEWRAVERKAKTSGLFTKKHERQPCDSEIYTTKLTGVLKRRTKR